MSFSDALELRVLDHVLNDGTDTPTTTLHVGLSSTTPTDAGTNITEPSGGAYARVSVPAATWDAAAAGAKSNGSIISFAKATADWLAAANLTYFVIMSALTAGSMEQFGALTTPKPVTNGDTPSFAIGALSFTLD